MTNLPSKFILKPRQTPKPPKGLGKFGRQLWNSIMTEYSVTDAGGIAHLTAAARCEDDIQRFRASIARDGDLAENDKSKPNPLIACLRGAEAVRRQSLQALRLDIEPLKGKK